MLQRLKRTYDQGARTLNQSVDRQQMDLDEKIRLDPDNADTYNQMKAQLEEIRKLALDNLLDTLKTDVRHFDFGQSKTSIESRLQIGTQLSSNFSAMGMTRQSKSNRPCSSLKSARLRLS